MKTILKPPKRFFPGCILKSGVLFPLKKARYPPLAAATTFFFRRGQPFAAP
jgi:hypothetical protein